MFRRKESQDGHILGCFQERFNDGSVGFGQIGRQCGMRVVGVLVVGVRGQDKGLHLSSRQAHQRHVQIQIHIFLAVVFDKLDEPRRHERLLQGRDFHLKGRGILFRRSDNFPAREKGRGRGFGQRRQGQGGGK